MAYIIELHNIGKLDVGDNIKVAFQDANSMYDFVCSNYWYLEHITCWDDQMFVFEIERAEDGTGCRLTDRHDDTFAFSPGRDDVSEAMDRIRDLVESHPIDN